MKWFIGVDGGGTKTDFAASALDGAPQSTLRLAGCSYQSIGIEAAAALIADGVRQCLAALGADLEDCAGCCIGSPCYGENGPNDRTLTEAVRTALAPAPVLLVNDVEVGWAGAQEGREGIHIVAGTGSIAFGRGTDRKTARCGGWNEFFGDEGSCYWVGREAMSLFSKEADGRLPRGALYDRIRREFRLTEDFGFTDVVLRKLAPYREKVAQFQIYAFDAAQAGDSAAAALFERAARELALMVRSLRERLLLPPGTANVTFSGGLFRGGELILNPLRRELEAIGCTLTAPRRSAVEGALILAIEQFNGRR